MREAVVVEDWEFLVKASHVREAVVVQDWDLHGGRGGNLFWMVLVEEPSTVNLATRQAAAVVPGVCGRPTKCSQASVVHIIWSFLKILGDCGLQLGRNCSLQEQFGGNCSLQEPDLEQLVSHKKNQNNVNI